MPPSATSRRRFCQAACSAPYFRTAAPGAGFQVEAASEGSSDRRQEWLDQVGSEDRGAGLRRPVPEMNHEPEALFTPFHLGGPEVRGLATPKGDAPLQFSSRPNRPPGRTRRRDEGSVLGKG